MKFFYMGGPLFMGILTFTLIAMIAWAVYQFLPVSKSEFDPAKIKARLKHIKTIGSFAAIFGVLCQLIGLYQAFNVIEEMGDVSQSLLAGGLKVSLIPTVYGILIFLISLILWFILEYIVSRKEN